MEWYIAKIVYRIICGDGGHTAQFDEQLRLIAGHSRADALARARITGARETDMFYNQKQQLVRWQFIDVAEIYRLGPLMHGAELYSRIEEKEDGDAYIDIIRKKAERLEQHVEEMAGAVQA